jgi:quinol monooxygenase YgiN
MVGGLKVLTIKPGMEKEFETLFTELRNEMRKHEPGCLLYSLLKSRRNPSDYIVQEQYVDQAALDFHSQSVHGTRYFPRMRAVLEKLDVEYFDGVVS